jgi:hypothetical protein
VDGLGRVRRDLVVLALLLLGVEMNEMNDSKEETKETPRAAEPLPGDAPAERECTPEEAAAQQRCLEAADAVLITLGAALIVDGSGFSRREGLATMASAVGKFLAITSGPDADEQTLIADLWMPLQGIALESMREHRKLMARAREG